MDRSADRQQVAESILATMHPVDRRLWRWAVLRALTPPHEGLRDEVAQRGASGATHRFLMTLWLALSLVFLLPAGLTLYAPRNDGGRVIAIVFLVLWFGAMIKVLLEWARSR